MFTVFSLSASLLASILVIKKLNIKMGCKKTPAKKKLFSNPKIGKHFFVVLRNQRWGDKKPIEYKLFKTKTSESEVGKRGVFTAPLKFI